MPMPREWLGEKHGLSRSYP